MINMETGRIRSAASVIHTLMESIMINTPIRVVTDVISCVRLWFRLICSVSTSFVTRERISPFVLLSK